jgi:hypothetical protein
MATRIRDAILGAQPDVVILNISTAVRRLPEDERRRLVRALQDESAPGTTEQQRREAMVSWVDLAGQFHSNFTDISTDKYRHLTHVYADER